MERLRIVAKLTQRRYGIKRYEAGFDILWNLIMVMKISTQRTRISTKPRIGERRPKNRIDHKKLKDN